MDEVVKRIFLQWERDNHPCWVCGELGHLAEECLVPNPEFKGLNALIAEGQAEEE